MIDSFVLLAPLLLLPLLALFSFVGCNQVFGIDETATLGEPVLVLKFRINCGGPTVPDADLAWEADDNTTGSARVNTGNPVIDIDNNNQPAGPIYETCRLGDGPPALVMSYTRILGAGDVVVNLKFGWFFSTLNDGQPFAIQISGDGTGNIVDDDFNKNFRFFTVSAPALIKFDFPPIPVKVDQAGNLSINFMRARDANGDPLGNFPYVNAIEISKYEQT